MVAIENCGYYTLHLLVTACYLLLLDFNDDDAMATMATIATAAAASTITNNKQIISFHFFAPIMRFCRFLSFFLSSASSKNLCNTNEKEICSMITKILDFDSLLKYGRAIRSRNIDTELVCVLVCVYACMYRWSLVCKRQVHVL